MTTEEHMKMIIGDLMITIAQQRAQIDALKEQVPHPPPAEPPPSVP